MYFNRETKPAACFVCKGVLALSYEVSAMRYEYELKRCNFLKSADS